MFCALAPLLCPLLFLCILKMASKRLQVVKGHLKTSPLASTDGEGPLTKEQLDQYDRDGFFVISGLYDVKDLEVYRKRFQEICNSGKRPPFMTIMKDVACKDQPISEFTVNKVQDFLKDPVLSKYCSDPRVLDIVEALVGKDIMAIHSMLINKPPDVGRKTSRHPLHQDLWYFPFRPAEMIVCSWTAMQWVYKENGCLLVFPGSHKGELKRHDYPEWQGGVNAMYHEIKGDSESRDPVYLEMQPGDTVFFHPLLIHGSGANMTNDFRKSISCHYASSHCDFIDVKGTMQESVAKEIEAVAKKRSRGAEITWKDVWQLKGLLVRGERGNFCY